jgi:hypothetical protein
MLIHIYYHAYIVFQVPIYSSCPTQGQSERETILKEKSILLRR